MLQNHELDCWSLAGDDRDMSNPLVALVSGFGLGLSLIVAIGAQNAFVLRQGLRGEHVPVVVAVCSLSDVALIAAGVAGMGVLIDQLPGVVDVIRVGGVLFLGAYAVLAGRRAIAPTAGLDASDATGNAMASTSMTAVALTWLNPHVYLDTVVLLGSIASSHGDLRWHFGAGAALGSVCWFTALGTGARLLRPIFARPAAWRVLDAGIACTMTFLAAGLARNV